MLVGVREPLPAGAPVTAPEQLKPAITQITRHPLAQEGEPSYKISNGLDCERSQSLYQHNTLCIVVSR